MNCDTQQLSEKASTESSYRALLQLYFGDIQEIYESFNLVHNKVIALIDTDSFDEQDAIRAEINKPFYRTKFYYNQIFLPIEALTNNMQHNLPKIKLLTFNGQAQDWESFIELFNSLVHNNALITKVEKFHYLLTSVTGPALDIIKTLLLQADNYTVAYNSL